MAMLHYAIAYKNLSQTVFSMWGERENYKEYKEYEEHPGVSFPLEDTSCEDGFYVPVLWVGELKVCLRLYDVGISREPL